MAYVHNDDVCHDIPADLAKMLSCNTIFLGTTNHELPISISESYYGHQNASSYEQDSSPNAHTKNITHKWKAQKEVFFYRSQDFISSKKKALPVHGLAILIYFNMK
jgi:hypothetical protein